MAYKKLLLLLILTCSCSDISFDESNSSDKIETNNIISNIIDKPIFEIRNYVYSSDFIKLDLWNCNNLTKSTYKISDEKQSELIIVGHAYGKPGEGDYLPPKLVNFLLNNTFENSSIALTGDFVRVSSLENLNKVKKFLDENFENFFISPGNHDLFPEPENYYQVFEKDFYFAEFNNYLLIAANFVNDDWLPSQEQKNKINSLIENTDKETVVILSHMIFWQNKALNVLVPNGGTEERNFLSDDPIGWININNKNLVIISGDYGAWGQKTTCYYNKNSLFIANGIGNHENDTVLFLKEYENVLFIEEVKLP